MQKKRYPVYFDPNSIFQIYNPDVIRDFPFEAGSSIEMEGTVIYHGISEWVKTQILTEAKWSASIYPKGRALSAYAYEVLIVNFRDVTNLEKTFEFKWAVDHETRLFIVSDRSLPSGLFESPKNGDETSVWLTLEVVETGSSNGSNQSPIILKPDGEISAGLILSEIRKYVD